MGRKSPSAVVAHGDRLARGARSAPAITSGRAAVASSSPCSASKSDRPTPSSAQIRDSYKRTKIATSAAGASRLGRRSAPAAGAGRSAHADARRAPRARVWAASMANAANFRSDFSSASRESASEAEFAKRGVAHVDRLARGARSAPSPAAAPRWPHHHPARPRRAIARAPSSAQIRRFVQKNKNRDVGSRREPLGRRSAPAAGAGGCSHADARRAPRARVWATSMANAANFRSDFSSASRESASEAEFAKRGVAHVDRLARGARAGTVTSGRAAVASSSPCSAASSDRPSTIVSPSARNSYKRTKIATSAAGASRSVAAALRRLGRVGLLTPMRAVPRARVWAASMANAANFRSDFSSASRALVRRNSPSGVLRTSTA